jgi:lysophospholipase L1-like esterase
MGTLNFLKSVVFRLTAILLGTLLALIIIEVLARTFLYQEPWQTKLELRQRHAEKFTYKKNKYNLRDDEFLTPKPSDHLRILILGDSFTFGLGVQNNKDIFPQILEVQLNEANPFEYIKKIEVLNGGLPGSLPNHWIRLYKNLVVDFAPDIVLIVFFLRDGTPQKSIPGFFKRITIDINLRNQNSWLYQHFFSYRMIRDLLDKSKISSEYTKKLKNGYFGNEKQTWIWKRTQKDLLDIKSLAEQTSAEVGFVIFPILVELNDNYLFRDICDLLEEYAFANEFPLHNLLPSFLGYFAPDLWVSPYNQHPNEKGHHIAAESMLPFIKKLLKSLENKDADNDGNPLVDDNCPGLANPLQENDDGDRWGNVCDNCWKVKNFDQTDLDGDCPEMPYTSDPMCGDACETLDTDHDGISDNIDNCLNIPNGPLLGTCVESIDSLIVGKNTTCTSENECSGTNEFCQMEQGDWNNNRIGDVCECYADYNYDKRIDGSDFLILKQEFGRNDCQVNSCQADCNGDGIVNTSDLDILKAQPNRKVCPEL